jgi:hypothetical protein
VGAIVLAKVEQGVMDEQALRGRLGAALTRADDRRLFDLMMTVLRLRGGSRRESPCPACLLHDQGLLVR